MSAGSVPSTRQLTKASVLLARTATTPRPRFSISAAPRTDGDSANANQSETTAANAWNEAFMGASRGWGRNGTATARIGYNCGREPAAQFGQRGAMPDSSEFGESGAFYGA